MKSIIHLTSSTFVAVVILTVASGTFDILNMQSAQLLPDIKVSLSDAAKTEQITIEDVDPWENPEDPCYGKTADPNCAGD